MEEVAPDGSPVEVYLALPAEPDLSLLRRIVPPGSSVLELGSGPGRLTNHLAADGNAVVAVDDSAAMLHHIVGAETVLADLWSLRLDRRFDVVLAMSHLINDRSPARRAGLLRTCRSHLDGHGTLVVQRCPPGWRPREQRRAVGEVDIHLHDVRTGADGFSAAVTYTLHGRSWTQRFDAAVVEDDELRSLAADAELVVHDMLDDAGAWVSLGPAPLAQ